MKTEEIKKQDELNDEQLDNVTGALRREDVIRKYLFPKNDSDAAEGQVPMPGDIRLCVPGAQSPIEVLHLGTVIDYHDQREAPLSDASPFLIPMQEVAPSAVSIADASELLSAVIDANPKFHKLYQMYKLVA